MSASGDLYPVAFRGGARDGEVWLVPNDCDVFEAEDDAGSVYARADADTFVLTPDPDWQADDD